MRTRFSIKGRLEPVTKTYPVEEETQARVKDPLWMLGRQWQTDEFTATGGGHLVRTEVDYDTSPMDELLFKKGNEPKALKMEVPLEAQVEGEEKKTSATGDIFANGNLTEGEDGREDEKSLALGWDPKHLEYNFSLQKGDIVLSATEYDGHYLDWFNFNLVKDELSFDLVKSHKLIFKPTPVSYFGKPSPRWWQFEDRNIDLGDVQRPYLNMLTMILVEFGLIFSEDWYIIPIEHTVGDIRLLKTMRSVDSFGVVIESKPKIDQTPNQQGFEVFTLHSPETNTDGRLFYLPNNLWYSLQSKPIEAISLLRDEMANLVWAIEHQVTLDNKKYNRHDTSTEEINNQNVPGGDPHVDAKPSHYLLEYYDEDSQKNEDKQILIKKPSLFEEGEPGEKILGPLAKYEESHYPLQHWIPYVQQFMDEEVILRRGRTQIKITPTQYWGVLLAESGRISEEEVLRSGISVTRLYQLARTTDGDRVLWCGRKKRPDQLRNSSDLRRDDLIE